VNRPGTAALLPSLPQCLDEYSVWMALDSTSTRTIFSVPTVAYVSLLYICVAKLNPVVIRIDDRGLGRYIMPPLPIDLAVIIYNVDDG
jgi:hypothetical protein